MSATARKTLRTPVSEKILYKPGAIAQAVEKYKSRNINGEKENR